MPETVFSWQSPPLWNTDPDADSAGSSDSQWQYDAAERLFSIPSLITTMTCDARGRVKTANYVNGVVQAYDYTGVRLWLDRITTTKTVGAVNHQTLDYARDLTGKITGVAETAFGQPNRTATYVYDDLERLTSLTNTDTSLNQTFANAPNGNITSNSRVGARAYLAQEQL